MTRDSKVPSLQPAPDDAPPEGQNAMESVKVEVKRLRTLHLCGLLPEGSTWSIQNKERELRAKLDKLKPEVTNDNRDHYQNPGTQLDADSNASQASRPARLDQEEQTTASSLVLGNTHLAPEESMAEPAPAQTDEGAAKKQSDLENKAVEKGFQNQSTAGDSMAFKRDSGQHTYAQDGRSGPQQTETKFPDAPWRKQTESECERPRGKTPPAPPPPPPRRRAMMGSDIHGDEQSVEYSNQWKHPAPPTPFERSETKRQSTEMKPHVKDSGIVARANEATYTPT